MNSAIKKDNNIINEIYKVLIDEHKKQRRINKARKELNWSCEYDFNNMHLIKLLLSEKRIICDIGANIGVYTLIAS